MLIFRRRYLKQRAAARIIQGRCKSYLAKQQVKKMRQEKIDLEKTRLLERHLLVQKMQQDKAKMIEEAAIKI